MAKALLLDTNFSSHPIYEYLVSLGIEVTVMGGNPKDFLAKSVENYICQNYSIADETKNHLANGGFDFLVPGCNDVSYAIASQIENHKYYGIDSPEVTDTINQKNLFRKFAQDAGLPVPKLLENSQIEKAYPVIVKPVDGYSGRGVKIIRENEKDDLADAIEVAKNFSKTKSYIVEKYVEGQLYSHSAFIRNQKIHTDFIVIENSTSNPFAVDTSRVIWDFPEETLSSIRLHIEAMAEKLSLKDGLIHTQFIYNEGEYAFIEITRRCPGDQYSMLIELSTGFPYAQAYANPFINLPNELPHTPKPKFIIRHTISYPEPTMLSGINFSTAVKIEKLLPLATAGDIVDKSPFGRIGVIFINADTQQEQLELYDSILHRKLYKIT